jgi:quinolinate synthase
MGEGGQMTDRSLRDRILELKAKKDALILVHNYQVPDVQDIGDFVGDSLELAIKAVDARKHLIVFCGVKFMAETAKILNPEAKVLIPRPDASCPMADMITRDDIPQLRREYPDALVCSYVNTNADVKAETDICCTSANAVKVVESLKAARVIFTPDRNLADFVGKNVSSEVIPFDGYCYVHARFSATDINRSRTAHPEAVVLVHPECNPEVVELADQVLSTSGMLRFAKDSPAKEFIIATEEGLIERMSRQMPEKRFYSAGNARVCFNMKRIRLQDVYESLDREIYEVSVDPEIMERARVALERMISAKM